MELKKLTQVLLLSLGFSLMLSAEPAGSPEISYTVSVCNVKGMIINQMEQCIAVLQKTKGKTTGSDYLIKGAKSGIRIKIQEGCFQVTSDQSSGMLDPNKYVYLYKLTSGKTGRSFTITDGGYSSPSLIPVTIELIEGFHYKVTVGSALVPGEYGFTDRTTVTPEGNLTVWAFGIDQ
jgi:hypothetical protein